MSNSISDGRPATPQSADQRKRLSQQATVNHSHQNNGLPFWLAILCLVLVAVGLRPTIVSVGPLLPEMVDAFGLSYTQASLLTAIPTLLMGLLALPTPWLAYRFGRDRVIIAALLGLALAAASRAVSPSAGALFISTAFTGMGIAFAGALIPGFVKAAFPTRAALLMGTYAMALSLGSTVAAATTGFLADLAGSWRAVIGLWAFPALIGAAAWGMVYVRQSNAPLPPRGGRAATLPVRNRTAWMAALFFACNNIIFYGFVAWLAPLYVELGRTSASAGLILATFTLAFTAGALVFGLSSRHEDRRVWLATSAGLALMGVVWMTTSPTTLPFVAVPIMAFGVGGAFTLAMTLPLDNARTPDEAGAWNAFVLLVSYPVGATGPVLVGLLRDLTGDFSASLVFLVISAGVMVALAPFLRPYHLIALKP
ncbi:MFS transporter [Pseudomonas azerbaijanoccidentalis]